MVGLGTGSARYEETEYGRVSAKRETKRIPKARAGGTGSVRYEGFK